MDQEKIELIAERLKQPLPGEDAQMRMSGKYRLNMRQALKDDPDPRLSAVLMLLFPINRELHTLLMQRPKYEGTHSGQISFPGGKKEDTDQDLLETALREANEEAGIIADDVKILGELSQLYIPPSRFLVTPYVGYVEKMPEFVPDPNEVEELITVPLSHLLDDAIVSSRTIDVVDGKFRIETPVYEIESRYIWGATAMIISEFKEIVRGI